MRVATSSHAQERRNQRTQSAMQAAPYSVVLSPLPYGIVLHPFVPLHLWRGVRQGKALGVRSCRGRREAVRLAAQNRTEAPPREIEAQRFLIGDDHAAHVATAYLPDAAD